MPIAAAIPAIIGAAGAIGGGALASNAAQGDTSSGRTVLNNTIAQTTPYGTQNIGAATNNLSQTGNFYRTLMSGNQQQIAQLLGPEISQVGQQYNTLAQSSAQLQPRQGLTASARAALPFQQESQVGNAILSAPLTGASGLTGISTAQGSLGSNLLGLSNQAGSSLGNIGLGIGTQGLQGASGGWTIGNNLAAGLSKSFPGVMGPS